MFGMFQMFDITQGTGIDSLIEFGASNTLFAGLISLAAVMAASRFKQVQLSHLLWMMAFIKLLTPAVVKMPLFHVEQSQSIAHEADEVVMPLSSEISHPFRESRAEDPILIPTETLASESSLSTHLEAAYEILKTPLILIWVTGSLLVLVLSLVRIVRFNHLLHQCLVPASDQMRWQAKCISEKLGLKRVPRVVMTSSSVSPMVWWFGRLYIVVPAQLVEELSGEELYWVMAHELAHVKRKDHLVRWLEWSVNVAFWWNPIVWWGRHQLRAVEEICCDALVLDSLKPKPRLYAGSVLSAIEHLAQSVIRPPVVASEINSDGFLERRFRMIVSSSGKRQASMRSRLSVLLFSCIMMPVGLVYADFEAVERKLAESVVEGDLSLEQAAKMLEVLKDEKREVEAKVERNKHRGDKHDKHDKHEKHGDSGKHEKHHLHSHELAKRFHHWIEKTGHDLKESVREGKLSVKEAWGKWEHFIKHDLKPKLEATVKSGKLSQMAADRLLNHVSKETQKTIGNDSHSDHDRKGHDEHYSKRSHNSDGSDGKDGKDEKHQGRSHRWHHKGKGDHHWGRYGRDWYQWKDGSKPDFEGMRKRFEESMKRHGLNKGEIEKKFGEAREKMEEAFKKRHEMMEKYRRHGKGHRGHTSKHDDKHSNDKNWRHRFELEVEDGKLKLNGKEYDLKDMMEQLKKGMDFDGGAAIYMDKGGIRVHRYDSRKHQGHDKDANSRESEMKKMKENHEKQMREMREQMSKRMKQMHQEHEQRMLEHRKRMSEMHKKFEKESDNKHQKHEKHGKEEGRSRSDEMKRRREMMMKRMREMREKREMKERHEEHEHEHEQKHEKKRTNSDVRGESTGTVSSAVVAIKVSDDASEVIVEKTE